MELTNEEDCLDAFAGVTTALSRNYKDGFIQTLSGDHLLIWKWLSEVSKYMA
jgi:hypothetical protein